MKVKDIMTADLQTCDPQMSAAAAAGLMWDGDCGFLPVVEAGTLLGVISMDDLVRAAGPRRVITHEQIIETLKAIYSHHHAADVVAV